MLALRIGSHGDGVSGALPVNPGSKTLVTREILSDRLPTNRINIPFNLTTLAVISLFFRPTRGRGGSLSGRIKSLDLLGCLIFVPGIFMVLLAMQTGGEDGVWGSATVIGLFAGGGVTLLLLVAWEWRRGDGAMIPGAVVARRTVVFTCLFAFTHMGAVTIGSYYLPAWFQAVQGVGPLDSGVRMLPTVGTQIVVTMTASALGEYHPFQLSLPYLPRLPLPMIGD